mgnify:CR=1 FL=1
MARTNVDCSEKAVIEAAKLRSTTAARTQRAENRAKARELRNAANKTEEDYKQKWLKHVDKLIALHNALMKYKTLPIKDVDALIALHNSLIDYKKVEDLRNLD